MGAFNGPSPIVNDYNCKILFLEAFRAIVVLSGRLIILYYFVFVLVHKEIESKKNNSF